MGASLSVCESEGLWGALSGREDFKGLSGGAFPGQHKVSESHTFPSPDKDLKVKGRNLLKCIVAVGRDRGDREKLELG